MKVTLNRLNQDYLFEAKGPNNVAVSIDNKTEAVAKGASPMELMLMAIGGCNAIDIISILKKQRQEVRSYKIEVEGKRKDTGDAKPFEAVHLTIYLEGDIAEAKAKRAAALSFEKYCSVSLTLTGCVAITYTIVLNNIKL
ncbi:OsmC family protein [Cochleicola gelatinilyticus]|uniref:Disulfide bond formation regulator n=1 Tax=Cochleicola gelatinilyticus TaxID=1763537 RepID=A0A167EZ59_9FLAO|nr:OsmC family protein [Cochleicola gelatinilyticus]OAB76027.1 disulfide bond formation regulator [Cochleicola gelatinilyticus]